MAIVKDWTEEAAEEITADTDLVQLSSVVIADIIARHTPFKPDTDYMPVPRCDQCKWWKPSKPTDHYIHEGEGDCHLIGTDHNSPNHRHPSKADAYSNGFGPGYLITKADFGCVEFKAKS